MRLSLAIANGCIADGSDIEWIHTNNDTFSAGLNDLIRATYTFVILRNPFLRLASCFLDKIVGQSRPALRLRELVAPDLNLDQITFDDFVHFLSDAAVRADNMHWRPQVNFLVYACYDDYFSIENFPAAVETIRARAGLEVVDARPLTAHGIERYRLLPADIDHSRTPVQEITRLKRLGDCPDPRSLFTHETIDLVGSLYADDIRLYLDKIGPLPSFPGNPLA